jgi:hypothetical protein
MFVVGKNIPHGPMLLDKNASIPWGPCGKLSLATNTLAYSYRVSILMKTGFYDIACSATSLPGVNVFARSPHLARSDPLFNLNGHKKILKAQVMPN